MKLRIESEAEVEAREAARWYEQQRLGLGLEFLVEVDLAIQRIGKSPEQFPRFEFLPEEESVRRLRLERFPYAIIYESDSSEVRILAVAHSRRRPDYWRERR